MSDGDHLLIPFASSRDEGCAAVLSALTLRHLEKLLARLAPADSDHGEETSLSMPHERALARACGLPDVDGRIPWGAWQVARSGRTPGDAAWALITPCHWQVGQHHVAMAHPHELRLDARDSQALLAAMSPYFEQDGIALEYREPTLWLARGEVFRELATASLDRVVGRAIDAWMPRSPEAGPLRRLQQEMQMLLYTHDVNEVRVQAGLQPVNSFWVSGTGALPASTPATSPAGLEVTRSLRECALRGDWHAWAAAWQQLDAVDCTRLLQRLDAGQRVTLTLCGDQAAHSWSSGEGGGMLRRLGSLFAAKQAKSVLEAL